MVALKQDSAFDADEAELQALRNGIASATFSSYDERLSQEIKDQGIIDFPDAQIPKWELEEAAQGNIVGSTLEVLKLRRRLLGNLYPFDIERSQITYVPSDNGVYEFFLATSEAVSHNGRKYQRLVRHFERVATHLSIAFLGPNSLGFRFGSPSESYFERHPTKFVPRVERMRADCGFTEDEWKVSSAKTTEKLIERFNDGKIDFVVRRSFGDMRPGGLAVVGQCGCGRNDVRENSSKHRDVSHSWLSSIFDRTTLPPPVLFFTTSQHIPDDSELAIKQSSGAALLFDRLRLVKLASEFPNAIDESYLKWAAILTEFVKLNPPTC